MGMGPSFKEITRDDLNLIVLALKQKAVNDKAVAKDLHIKGDLQYKLYLEQARHAAVLAKQIAGV